MAETVEVGITGNATGGLNAIESINKGFGGMTNAASSAMSSIGSLISTGLAAAGVAVAGAVVAVGSAAVNLAMDVDAAARTMQVQLGVTAEEAQKLGDVALDVFGNNFAGSMEEAGVAAAEVQRLLGLPLSEGAAIQAATEDAFRLKDAFGLEVNDSVQTVDTLMKNFGLTSEEAFDFITTGIQKGLNRSGDFLDTINEYSTQFSSGGASADNFFSIMETGLGSGMLGTDKAADSFKEFRLRIADGSDATAAALNSIGLNSESMSQLMASGQLSAAQAFEMVRGKIGEVDDKNLQMQAGVALLGTQFEDLGTASALGLSMTTVNIDNMAGATDALDVQYQTLPAMFEGVWRRFIVALEPAASTLLDMGQMALPFVTGAIDTLKGAVEGVANVVAAFRSGGVGGVVQALGLNEEQVAILQTVIAKFLEFKDKLTVFASELSGNIAGMIQSGLGAITGLWTTYGDDILRIVGTAWEGVSGLISGVMDAIQGIITAAGQAMNGDWEGAWQTLQDATASLVDGILAYLGAMVSNLQIVFGEWGATAWQWIVGVAPIVLEKIGEMVGALVQYIQDWWPVWVEIFKIYADAAWTWIESAIPVVIEKASEMITGLIKFIGDSLPGWTATLLQWATAAVIWIGEAVPPMIEKAGEFIAAFITWGWTVALPGIIKTVVGWGQALVSWLTGDAATEVGPEMSKFETALKETLGKVGEAIVNAAMAIGTAIVNGIWSGVTSLSGWLAERLGELGTNMLQSVKDALGIKSPSLEFAYIGHDAVRGLAVGIEEMTPLATGAATLLAREVVGALGRGMAAIATVAASSITPLVNVMPQLGSGLDAITDSTNQAASAMGVLASQSTSAFNQMVAGAGRAAAAVGNTTSTIHLGGVMMPDGTWRPSRRRLPTDDGRTKPSGGGSKPGRSIVEGDMGFPKPEPDLGASRMLSDGAGGGAGSGGTLKEIFKQAIIEAYQQMGIDGPSPVTLNNTSVITEMVDPIAMIKQQTKLGVF